MAFLVLTCPGCGASRVAEAHHATVQCTQCGKRIELARAIVHARTPSLDAARDALGQVNADKAGGELVRDLTPIPVRPADALDRGIDEARSVRNEQQRARLAAEGLTQVLGTFTEEDWTEALGRLDIPRGRALEHLERLVARNALAQPRPLVFQWVA